MNTLRIIENKLIEIGMNPALSGFYCTMHAINYFLENDKDFYQVSVTKDLYPYISEKLGSGKISRVERNIRKSIEDLLNRNTSLIKYTDIDSGKMTNSHFISFMVLQIKKEIEENELLLK